MWSWEIAEVKPTGRKRRWDWTEQEEVPPGKQLSFLRVNLLTGFLAVHFALSSCHLHVPVFTLYPPQNRFSRLLSTPLHQITVPETQMCLSFSENFPPITRNPLEV